MICAYCEPKSRMAIESIIYQSIGAQGRFVCGLTCTPDLLGKSRFRLPDIRLKPEPSGPAEVRLHGTCARGKCKPGSAGQVCPARTVQVSSPLRFAQTSLASPVRGRTDAITGGGRVVQVLFESATAVPIHQTQGENAIAGNPDTRRH